MAEQNQGDLDPAMVEAAIKAGEQAAAEDMKAEAQRAKAERDDLLAQLSDAQAAYEKAQTEADEAKARTARLQADWDNFRKRTANEREQEKARATEKMVEQLLPAIDDLERAIDHAKTLDDAQVTEMAQGVEAVHQKILEVFERQGVEVIDPVGEAFDPLEDQAVGRVEDAQAYDDSVAQVLRRGYRMGGKVLRSAMVTVTFGGPKRPAEDDADKQEQ